MLKVKKISHTFKDSKHAIETLSDISFDINKNDFVSIIGPSGCGKTTLINILAGYSESSKGYVLINNKKITGPGKDRIVINQEDDLFEWMTVEKNLGFGSKDKRSVNKYLKLLNLSNFKNRYPHQISGGMKKKTTLGRALAAEGTFIIMDEPFNSLDYQYREKLHTNLLNIWKKTKKTILLVTHDIEEAIFLSNKIIVFSNRPAKIKKVINVDFSYPRDYRIKNHKDFIKLKDELRRLI